MGIGAGHRETPTEHASTEVNGGNLAFKSILPLW